MNKRKAPSSEPGLANMSGPLLALRPVQAARAIGISKRLLASLTAEGVVPHVRISSRVVVYPVQVLQDWLAKNSTKGDAQ